MSENAGINQAIEKLEKLVSSLNTVGYIEYYNNANEILTGLRGIEKVTYSKILEAESQSTKNAIKVVDEINKRIWGK